MKNIQNNKKTTIVMTGILATIAILSVSSIESLNALDQQAVLEELANKPTPTIPNAFIFHLPEDAVDGKRYMSVTNGGIPETTLEQGSSTKLPLIIESRSDEVVTIDFYTTYGAQRDAAKVNPNGVGVSVVPNQLTLQPKEHASINLVVTVDNNAPDGLYHQQVIGEWGDVNEFAGTGIYVKVGAGASEFMHPGTIGNE